MTIIKQLWRLVVQFWTQVWNMGHSGRHNQEMFSGNNSRSQRKTEHGVRPPSFQWLIPCCWVSTETGSPPPDLHLLFMLRSISLSVDFLILWQKAGIPSRLMYLPTCGRVYSANTNSSWFREIWVKAQSCHSFSVCLASLFTHVSGMVFKGEGEGQGGQGPAAKWTSVQHRLLFGPQHVRGVWQTSFWKGPAALLQWVKVYILYFFAKPTMVSLSLDWLFWFDLIKIFVD